jgi:hypothetical protein
MTAKIITQTFEQFSGLPCWGVKHGQMMNLSMNFGTPSLRIREPIISNGMSEWARRKLSRRNVTVGGEWFLWLFGCFWHLSSNGNPLATGSSSQRKIDQAICELDGQKLIEATVNPINGATSFSFDLGCLLECRRFGPDSNTDLWSLYKPSGFVLSVYGNGTFTHGRGTSKNARYRRILDGRIVTS